MKHHLFVVAAYAKDGRVRELGEWYENQHIPDLLAIPGIVKATRYEAQAVKLPPGVATPDCVTIYEFDAADPMSIIGEMGKRTETGVIQFTDAMDRSRTIAYVASPV